MREQYLVKYVQEELMENKNKKHVNPSTINNKTYMYKKLSKDGM